MGEQLPLFPSPPPDADDRLNAAQAAIRRERMARGRSRSERAREVRGRTIDVSRLTKTELAIGQAMYPLAEHASYERPQTRGDCVDAPRPCPWAGCRHHLYLDVTDRGSIRLNFPDVEADELELLPATCSLDVAAETDGLALESVADAINLTRERARHVERDALARISSAVAAIYPSVTTIGRKQRRHLPVVDVPPPPKSGIQLRREGHLR